MLPGGYQQQYAFPPAGAPFPGQPSPHGSAAHAAGAYYGAPQPPYGAQTMPGYGYPQDPYGRGMPPGGGPAPGMMSEREHERATKDWQKQMKQSQKEAEKRARKEAKEAEKFKAQWEKGERERQKAEEKEARELERARARDRGSVASSGHQRSVSAAVPGSVVGAMPGAIPTRERKLSNAMGFDKYGDTLAGQMDALSLGGAGADPARRERRTSTAGPPPPGVGAAGRARRYSNAGYDRDPYAAADSAAAYDRRAAAAQQAQDDAYARAASNAYYVQGERAAPASAVGDPAGALPLAGAASQSMWDPRGRERDYARDRGVRERDYAGREAEDPYAPAPPGAYPSSGASRSPYEDPLRAAPGSIPGHPPAVDPYAAAGAPAYAHNAPYAAGGAAPGAYGAAPPVAGAHHSPSGYAPAITPSHSPYARDPALGAGVPGAPAAHDPYASNSSYYGTAGASRYGAGSGYAAGAQDRSPYGAAAQGPPPLTSAVPGAAAGAYAYASRAAHDPYAAAAPAPYGGASRSPYDRHSAPPAPRGDPYAPVPGASVGAYGQQPPSPYDRNPPPGAYDRNPQPAVAGAYGAPGAAYGAGGRAPSPLPYGAAAGGRAPSPLPYGAAAGGRTPSPLPYPRHAAQAFAQHAQEGDPTLGLGGRSGPPSPYDRDPYGHGGGARGGYEPEAEPMPSSPPGFHRQPNQSHKYTPFEAFLILDDLDGFYRETPHMPAALVSHDVFHEDWIRFMQDLAFAWSGRIPAPELGRDGRQPHHGAIVADLVDVWNMRFFHPRRVELIVYHGRAPVSGRRGAPAEEDDYSSRKWSLCLRCLSGGHPAAAGFPPGGVPSAYA